VGFAWSTDAEIDSGGSVATGRVSNAGQIEGADPDEKGHLGTPCWGGGGVGGQPDLTPKKVEVETISEMPRRTAKEKTIWL
jgi:hypothetical protein